MDNLSENKKAYFTHEILEKFEAGISLIGQEVKSLKTKGVNLAGTYVLIRGGEAFWVGAKIPPYQPKNAAKDYDPERPRKLLLRKDEISSLAGRTQQKGLTLIPLRVYNSKGKLKLEIGLARGRKTADKRDLLKKRDTERDIRRALRTF